MGNKRWQCRAVAFATSMLVMQWSHAKAQDAPMPLERIVGQVTLDGNPDEPAWQAIAPLPLTMYLPVSGGTPTQRTIIRVAYDDENLYAAGWFYDTDPSGIRINSLYRDRWNGDDALEEVRRLRVAQRERLDAEIAGLRRPVPRRRGQVRRRADGALQHGLQPGRHPGRVRR